MSLIAAETPQSIDIYLDTSVSSTNFGRAQLTPYRDVLAFLADEAESQSGRNLFGFANSIAPINVDVVAKAASGTGRVCMKCGYSETRLDDLLSRISSDPKAPLSIIVTDLWLDNDNVFDQRSLSLSRPLREIMASGNAIGVVGVRAPYSDIVYDIPVSGGKQPLPSGRVKERPFFILLIGTPSEVLGAREMLFRDVFAADEGATGGNVDARFALYSPVPVVGRNGLEALEPHGEKTPFAYAPSYISDNENIPVFAVDRGGVGDLLFAKEEADDAGTTAWGGGNGLSFTSGVGKGDKLGVSMRAWELEGPLSDACDAESELESWVEINDFPRVFSVAKDGDGVFVYEAAQSGWLDLPVSTTYYVEWSAVAKEPLVYGSSQWMIDWSFSADRGAALMASPPGFFPVLNLHNFQNLLIRAQADASSPAVIASGAAVITTE
ncbi:MAG: hypothetical protein ACSHXY_06055 [Alphaproteobacteria bacterium]